MNFSIRQILIVTVALAIPVATVSSIFRLKQTQVQIVQAQQLISEKNTQEKQLEFQLKNVDGVILKRTIELDALRELSDPEQAKKIVATERVRILSELKPSSKSITVAKLPSLDGLAFAIIVPNEWDVFLKVATNETDSTVRDVAPPYSNFLQPN